MVKGFSLEYLAMVSVKNTGKYNEIYNAMVEVLMGNQSICLYGKCDGCKDVMTNNKTWSSVSNSSFK